MATYQGGGGHSNSLNWSFRRYTKHPVNNKKEKLWTPMDGHAKLLEGEPAKKPVESLGA